MVMQRGPWGCVLLQPVSSTFIAQVTGNEVMAADVNTVVAIATTLSPHWMLFWEATKLALR
jgi:hypothetical protein